MEILGREFEPRRVLDNPPESLLRDATLKQGARLTVYGNISVVTRIRSRSAKFTTVYYGIEPSEEDEILLDKVFGYIREREFIKVDRTMCTHPDFRTACRVYVDANYARLPYMWSKTLFPPQSNDQDPEFTTIVLPDWPQRKVMVFPEDGVTLILGSDYMGEIKKSMLRLMMFKAKRKFGFLGLHAGSKILRVYKRGKLEDVGFLFFGLSGTGKTTLSCHSHWLKYPEGVIIRQDDVVILTDDGRAIGTEDGFYIKTENLDPYEQPLLYAAALSPRTILENVMVYEDGRIDFQNYSLTTNGRAVVKRSDVAYTDEKIDLERVHKIIFVVRRYDVVPPVARLTPEWGAAAFMLGESIETSAGDPSQAGKPLHVVGTNPFIIGDEAEEGNIFYKILRKNEDIECYMLNTGWVGGKGRGAKIGVTDSVRILEMIARDKIRWIEDEIWGYEIPREVPGVNIDKLDPRNYYSEGEYLRLNERLREDRLNWLKRFKNLDPRIVKAVSG